jgi:hypothetical protein
MSGQASATNWSAAAGKWSGAAADGVLGRSLAAT